MSLKDLAVLAVAKQMIPSAPVSASRLIDVYAPVATVWETLTAVHSWPDWYPYLKAAHLHGPFEAGTRLTYGGLVKHDLRLALVEAPTLVMIYGTMMGYNAITRWDLLPLSAAKVQVKFTESSAGFLIGSLYSGEKLGIHLQKWLEKLKTTAEANAEKSPARK